MLIEPRSDSVHWFSTHAAEAASDLWSDHSSVCASRRRITRTCASGTGLQRGGPAMVMCTRRHARELRHPSRAGNQPGKACCTTSLNTGPRCKPDVIAVQTGRALNHGIWANVGRGCQALRCLQPLVCPPAQRWRNPAFGANWLAVASHGLRFAVTCPLFDLRVTGQAQAHADNLRTTQGREADMGRGQGQWQSGSAWPVHLLAVMLRDTQWSTHSMPFENRRQRLNTSLFFSVEIVLDAVSRA